MKVCAVFLQLKFDKLFDPVKYLLRYYRSLTNSNRVNFLCLYSFVWFTGTNSDVLVSFVNLVGIWWWNILLLLDILIDEGLLFLSSTAIVWFLIEYFDSWFKDLVWSWRQVSLLLGFESNKFSSIEVSSWSFIFKYIHSHGVVVRGTLFTHEWCLSEYANLILFSVT